MKQRKYNLSGQSAQSLVEYIALTALVAIVSISAVKIFGGKVHRRLQQITTSFDSTLQKGMRSRSVQKDEAEVEDTTQDQAGDSNKKDAKPFSGIQIPF